MTKPVYVSWDLAREGDYGVACLYSYDRKGKITIHETRDLGRPKPPTTKEYDLELQPDGSYAPRQVRRADVEV